MKVCLLFMSLVLASSQYTCAQSNNDLGTMLWGRFRGPQGAGKCTDDQVATVWSKDQGLLWKTPLPGAGASSPIVFQGRAYLTAYSGFFVPGESAGSPADLTRHLLAIDLSNGKIVWQQKIPALLPEEESIRDHGFAANSVAVDAERIYAFFGKSGVFAFDHQGKQLWKTSVGTQTHGWGTAASPVIHGDLVFINASVESESLVALDRKTGRQVWKTTDIRESWNTPILITSPAGREELVLATQGTIKAFAPTSGKLLWSCETDITWYMVPSIVEHDGIVYCLGGRSGTAGLAVRTGGDGDVTASHRLWTSRKGANVSSPVYHQGFLYWVNEARETAYCADVATGNVVYEQRLPRGGQFYASALLVDDAIYYVNRDGQTFVLAAKPKYEPIATNDLRDGSVFNATPTTSDGRLLIRSDKFLYCIAPAK